jgi:hypothetical protein
MHQRVHARHHAAGLMGAKGDAHTVTRAHEHEATALDHNSVLDAKHAFSRGRERDDSAAAHHDQEAHTRDAFVRPARTCKQDRGEVRVGADVEARVGMRVRKSAEVCSNMSSCVCMYSAQLSVNMSNTHIFIYLHAFLHIYIHASMHACMHACMYMPYTKTLDMYLLHGTPSTIPPTCSHVFLPDALSTFKNRGRKTSQHSSHRGHRS